MFLGWEPEFREKLRFEFRFFILDRRILILLFWVLTQCLGLSQCVLTSSRIIRGVAGVGLGTRLQRG